MLSFVFSKTTTSLSFTKRSIYDFINGMYNKPIRNSNEFNFVLNDPINDLRELYQNVNLLKTFVSSGNKISGSIPSGTIFTFSFCIPCLIKQIFCQSVGTHT